MIVDKLQQLGQYSIAKIQGIGRATIMLFGALIAWPTPRKSFPLLLKQLYVVGVLAAMVAIIVLTLALPWMLL